jgi:L-aminopeptidase/D-esterase-like protein
LVQCVPIVPQAILFDLLNGGNKDWGTFSPYRQMGYDAFKAANRVGLELGTVGAGTGATTACFKGGLGSASIVTSGGHTIAALVAVNALGSPTVGGSKHFWAAPFEHGDEFGGIGSAPSILPNDLKMRIKGANLQSTTIGMVVTDAVLTKAQAHRLSIMAHDGLARAIVPAHLAGDGDTMFAAATAKSGVPSSIGFSELCHEASIVMSRAIARGMYHATALPYAGAQGAWRDAP